MERKKITSKIDTGRKSVVTSTLFTSKALNASKTSKLVQIPSQNSENVENSDSLSNLSKPSSSTSTTSRFAKFRQGGNFSSRPLIPRSNMTALFHDEIDTTKLSAATVRNARKSGTLNLASRNLTSGNKILFFNSLGFLLKAHFDHFSSAIKSVANKRA